MFRFMRVLGFFLLLGMGLGVGKTEAQAGYAHFIYDATSGKVLASENADVINHPASLTKMMTLYLTFEALKQGRLSWDQQIVMTPNAASKIPFKLGIKPGQMLTVREAVYGMAIRSANDAAAAMADHLGGDEERFGQMMTAKARALGMTKTVFRNASGLPDDAQITSARDMATMALSLIRDFPQEYQIFSMRSFQFRGRKIPGHNHLMYRYPGMDGVKTGFVNASGYNIASAVTINGRRVIGVVMGGKSARKRDDQMAALLDQYAAPAANTPGGLLASGGVQTKPAATTTPLAFATQPREITFGSPPAKASMGTSTGTSASASQPAVPRGSLPAKPSLDNLGVVERSGRSSWQIQISTAGSRDAASALLERALPLLSENFGQAAPNVEGYAEGGKQYFRARFAGFDNQQSAASACALLKAKSVNCFVVR